MSQIRRKRGKSGIVGNAVLLLVILTLAAYMVLPLLYTVNNAFKPINELFLFPPRIFVQNPTLNNFIELFGLLNSTAIPFARYFFNTLFVTLVGTVGQIVFASMCAYSISKIPYPGADIIFKIIVLSLMFSSVVTAVPNYIIMSKLKLIDTYLAIILPSWQTPLGLYLMKQFMESTIPDEILDAARIDGANELTVFFRIVMPLLKPAWFTLMIFSVQSLWNIVSPYTFSEKLKTLPQALSQIVSGGMIRSGAGSAIALLMVAVPITCFVITQSNIIQTMSTSGMKG